jgi:hypothetical protein
MADIFMLMQPTSGKAKGCKIVSIRKVQKDIGQVAVANLLAIHAISGCDTTSAIFGHGKVSMFRKLVTSVAAQTCLDIMSSTSCTPDVVAAAGCKLLVLIYGGKDTDNLNRMRYTLYMSMCASFRAKPVPERLPPTEDAAFFHCLRAYCQTMEWKMLQTGLMNAEEWGWKKVDGKYEPVTTAREPGPPELLNVIRCCCKSTNNQCASTSCTCRKNGLLCVSACGKCHGVDCMNTQPLVAAECDDVCDDEPSEGELASALLMDDDLDWCEEEVVS